MCDRRGVVTICKERKMGGACVSVRTWTVLVLSSLAPVPRLCRRWKVGGGREGGSFFVFVASLSVRFRLYCGKEAIVAAVIRLVGYSIKGGLSRNSNVRRLRN